MIIVILSFTVTHYLFHEDLDNDRGDILVEFCAQNNLRINNTIVTHVGTKIITRHLNRWRVYIPKVRFLSWRALYTFINTQGHQTMIHYIITNR